MLTKSPPYRSGGLPIAIVPSRCCRPRPKMTRQQRCRPPMRRPSRTWWGAWANLGWLSSNTRPDLMAVHSFLSPYSSKPSLLVLVHITLCVLHYVHLTHKYDISFSLLEQSKPTSTIRTPRTGRCTRMPARRGSRDRLTTYIVATPARACRRSGPRFSFSSSGDEWGVILFKSGGPIGGGCEISPVCRFSGCATRQCRGSLWRSSSK